MKISDQDRIYLEREADAFYARNLGDADPGTLRPAKRRIAEILDAEGVRPKRVVEYGCSHGDLVHHFARALGAEAHGVEPSGAAVARGREAYGDAVRLHQGTIADNPLNRDPASSARFDLVVVEDVLCWVSRETLFQSIANLDDVLCEGGHLFLREFLPLANERNRNHHLEDETVYCYKPAAPHSRIFTASGIYEVVWGRTWIDRGDPFAARDGGNPFDARWSDVLLRKSTGDYYPTASR